MKVVLSSLALCMLLVLATPGMQSEAAVKKPTCAKTQTVYLTKSDPLGSGYYLDYTELSSYIFIRNLSKNAKITNITSSNKKITGNSGLTWEEFPNKSGKFISLNGTNCKPGQKSTITFKVKQNGKTYKLSCKITLKLKPSNFKTFSIGGKNYASKLKGYSGTGKVANLEIRPLKGTFKIQMQSGIKLEQVKLVRGSKTTKIIKNGSKVTFKKGDVIQISYKYTKKPANYNIPSNSPSSGPSLYTLHLGGITVINVI